MQEKNPNITILSPYLGDKKLVKCKCLRCGYEWSDSPTHLKQGRGCSNCKRILTQQHNGQVFIQKAISIHNNKYDYSKVNYVNNHTKVTITCPIHGDFDQTPNSHLNGRGCPLCAGNNFNRDKEYFIQRAREVHHNDYDYSLVNYVTCKDKVEIKCLRCGNTFSQTPDHHLQGQGCPKCQLVSQRRLYDRLQKSFPNEVILFEVGSSTIKWLDGQRFDIYFPSINAAVEYNGEQHYIPIQRFGGELGFEETRRRDSLKRIKCQKNGCTLFEVKYNYTNEEYESLVNKIKDLIICHQ